MLKQMCLRKCTEEMICLQFASVQGASIGIVHAIFYYVLLFLDCGMFIRVAALFLPGCVDFIVSFSHLNSNSCILQSVVVRLQYGRSCRFAWASLTDLKNYESEAG